MLLGAPGAERRTAALLAALVSERDIFRRDGDHGPHTTDVATRLAVLAGSPADTPAGVDRGALSTVRRRAGELTRRSAPPPAPPWPPPCRRRPQPRPLECGPRLAPGGGLPRPHRPTARPRPVPASAWGWRQPPRTRPPPGGRMAGGGGTRRTGGHVRRADGRIRLAGRPGAFRHRTDRRPGRHHGGKPSSGTNRLDDLRVATRTRLDSLDLGSWTGPAQPGPATTAALVARAVRTGLADLRWTPATRSLQTRAGLGSPGPRRGLARPLGRRPGGPGRRMADNRSCAAPLDGPNWLESTRPCHSEPRWEGAWSSWIGCCRPPSGCRGGGARRSTTETKRPAPRCASRTLRHHHPPVCSGGPGAGHPRAAVAGRPAHPDHGRPPGFWTGSWAPGPQGDGRPLPQAPLAEDPTTAAPPVRRTAR